ncbi:MAG TPA: peptide deformylase [Alphaproteobacteria bacterium]|nr:peptide deformylase [Alphaproteobacteria bacterium]
MAKLTILEVPDPRLHQVSQPIEYFDNNLDKLAFAMLATTSLENGVGLSAPQVGVLQRLFVMDLSLWGIKKAYVVANPEIVDVSDETVIRQEACLSIPSTRGKGGTKIAVVRHRFIKLRYQNGRGKQYQRWLGAKASWISQHEVNHLNGVLITDNLPQVSEQPIQLAC